MNFRKLVIHIFKFIYVNYKYFTEKNACREEA
jgi:hypothetical protein